MGKITIKAAKFNLTTWKLRFNIAENPENKRSR